jgi:hypothetical protein
MSEFVTAEFCAAGMIDAGLNGDRWYFTHKMHTLIQYAMPFTPQFMLDRLVDNGAHAAWKKQK